jgi:hypothetical protein
MANEIFVKRTATQLQEAVTKVYKTAYGNNFNTDKATVNGVLIQEQMNLLATVESHLAETFSLVYDPRYSYGRYLDAVYAFGDVARQPSTRTTVSCQLTGIAGTVLKAGEARALSTAGDEFKNIAQIELVSGTTTATFQAVKSGAITAPIGSINRVIQQVVGWDTINNIVAGVVGKPEETDNAFRLRAKKALYSNAFGMLQSLITALINNPDIDDFNIVENRTDVPDTTHSVTILPHSIYVFVWSPALNPGGKDVVGEIIVKQKPPGCNMNGITTGNIIDPKYYWQRYPYQFDWATEVSIQMNITIGKSDLYAESIIATIQNALGVRFEDKTVTPTVQMAESIAASWFYSTLNSVNVYDIRVFTIGRVGGSQGLIVDLEINESPTLNATADIYVTLVD